MRGDVQIEGEWHAPKDLQTASGMTWRVMKMSGFLIRTERQANVVLVIFAILIAAAALYFFLGDPLADFGIYHSQTKKLDVDPRYK